ncbi:hypothetical protein F1559_002202 [Cyanidiococcus yangmingshanensis]|uniref:Mitochondrial folate transporter/carrier n=1 Tax=Cyanidiococcus yangmingshanensis TaxID=2690220 RepID=A0A7J7IIQ0_9RHOD|nr:hypothetical protein F1559_002202 [Cyanidiococcus yangmingshanensis]
MAENVTEAREPDLDGSDEYSPRGSRSGRDATEFVPEHSAQTKASGVSVSGEMGGRQESEIISPVKAPRGLAHAVAGVSGGCLSTLVLHPFDLIKTRLQATDLRHESGYYSYRSIANAVATIIREEGLRNGLYRGALPAVVGSSLSWGIYFACYQRAKTLIAQLGHDVSKDYLSESGSANHLLSGTLAGIITVLLTNPIWLLKTRIQLEKGLRSSPQTGPAMIYPSGALLTTVRSLWREEGFRGFYRGLGPSILLVTHGAIQFAAYERIRRIFMRRRLATSHRNQDISESDASRIQGPITNSAERNNIVRLSVIESLLAATASKVIASVLTYPLQVARTRMQQQGVDMQAYGSLLRALRTIYSRNGLRGFYRGVVANLCRVTPSSAITFVCYEQIAQLLSASY